jgi:hypothetical protein
MKESCKLLNTVKRNHKVEDEKNIVLTNLIFHYLKDRLCVREKKGHRVTEVVCGV